MDNMVEELEKHVEIAGVTERNPLFAENPYEKLANEKMKGNVESRPSTVGKKGQSKRYEN